MNDHALIEALNAYTGDNVWQDIIHPSGLLDQAATDAIDGGDSSDEFVTTNGRHIRYDQPTSQWVDGGAPEQPDGIHYDSHDLPDPVRAAKRVTAHIEANGDGTYLIADGHPLYARDLEAMARILRHPDRLLEALTGEGFDLPYAARARDHTDAQQLRAADDQAHQDNLAALIRALAGVK